MKILIYLKRILMLPFAWILWTVSYSIMWIKNGGTLILKNGKEVDPETFYELLVKVNTKLDKIIEND